MGLQVTTAAITTPVSIAEAQLALGIEHSYKNEEIKMQIEAATAWCQNYTGLQFMPATFTYTFDAFPSEMIIAPVSPVSSITSITYTDSAGTSTGWTDYTLDNTRMPARIVPAYGTSMPTARNQVNAISMVFVAGYTSASTVPSPIKEAIKQLVKHYFINGQPIITGTISTPIAFTVTSLLAPYKVFHKWS